MLCVGFLIPFMFGTVGKRYSSHTTLSNPNKDISFPAVTNDVSKNGGLNLRTQFHWFAVVSDNVIRSDASRGMA